MFLIHETGPIEAVELWLEELRHKYGGTEKFVDVVEKAVKAGLDLDPSQALIFLRTVLAQRDCNAERCLRAMRTVRCLQTTTTTLLTELKLTSADYSSIAELLATAVHFSGLKELEQFARESVSVLSSNCVCNLLFDLKKKTRTVVLLFWWGRLLIVGSCFGFFFLFAFFDRRRVGILFFFLSRGLCGVSKH